jgi:hypothetical protein
MRKGLVGASITVASIIPLLGVSGSLREARLLCSCNLIITVFFHESQSIRIELDGQLYKFKNKKRMAMLYPGAGQTRLVVSCKF